MRLRGRWLEYRIGDTMVPLMPTLHPAYLLRQPAHKKLAWRDLAGGAVPNEDTGPAGNCCLAGRRRITRFLLLRRAIVILSRAAIAFLLSA